MKGYAYGTAFIISSSDGGQTWVSETPPELQADMVGNAYMQVVVAGAQLKSAWARARVIIERPKKF